MTGGSNPVESIGTPWDIGLSRLPSRNAFSRLLRDPDPLDSGGSGRRRCRPILHIGEWLGCGGDGRGAVARQPFLSALSDCHADPGPVDLPPPRRVVARCLGGGGKVRCVPAPIRAQRLCAGGPEPHAAHGRARRRIAEPDRCGHGHRRMAASRLRRGAAMDAEHRRAGCLQPRAVRGARWCKLRAASAAAQDPRVVGVAQGASLGRGHDAHHLGARASAVRPAGIAGACHRQRRGGRAVSLSPSRPHRGLSADRHECASGPALHGGGFNLQHSHIWLSFPPVPRETFAVAIPRNNFITARIRSISAATSPSP